MIKNVAEDRLSVYICNLLLVLRKTFLFFVNNEPDANSAWSVAGRLQRTLKAEIDVINHLFSSEKLKRDPETDLR